MTTWGISTERQKGWRNEKVKYKNYCNRSEECSKNLSVSNTAEEIIHEHELRLVEITQTKANKKRIEYKETTNNRRKQSGQNTQDLAQYQMA